MPLVPPGELGCESNTTKLSINSFINKRLGFYYSSPGATRVAPGLRLLYGPHQILPIERSRSQPRRPLLMHHVVI